MLPERQISTEKLAQSGEEAASSSSENPPAQPASGSVFGLPSRLWARLLMLFCGLAGIKFGLLWSLRKELYETHWRISGVPDSWVNSLAFYGFILLGFVSLGTLAHRCRKAGVKTVRAANAAVLLLGLLFIFLTFHSGESNYLYPVMTGLLKWSNLVPYLSLDLFFHPPFLGAWIGGYVIGYYLMVRTGREDLSLHLTTIVAGAFAILHLRELLYFRNELLVADCFGLACLLVNGRFSGPFRLFWLSLPIAWSLFYCALFRSVSDDLVHLNPYFIMLAGETIVLFGAVTLWARKYGFLQAWARPLFFYFTAFFLVANANYPCSLNYDQLLCVALEVPRYFMGEFAVVAFLAALAGIYVWKRPNGPLWWLDLLGLILIIIAAIDFRLSQIMGARLDWDILSFGDSPKMMWRLARPYLPGVSIGVVGLTLIYTFGVRALTRWLASRLRSRSNPATTALCEDSSRLHHALGPGFWYTIASFLCLGVVGTMSADPDKAEGQSALRFALSSPLWHRTTDKTLTAEEFHKTGIQLGLGTFQPASRANPGQPPRDLNVLLVFMESSYNKHLALFGREEETQPLLSKYKERMEVFPNFFSAFAGSIHARFATFTSLYPVRDFNTFTSRRVEVKSLFEVLHDQGYTCSLFYSSFFTYTGFGDFLKGRGLDEMYDADSMPGQRSTQPISWGLREEETFAAMREQIKKYASSNKRFFLTYVPAAPHFPYDDIPNQFRKYKQTKAGDCTPRYLDALLYMDWVLDSLLEQLKTSGLLEKTLVIITNDHGEMLGGDGGPIGHGWAVTPELVNTPLIVMDPQNPGLRVNDTIGSQVDLLPTVLDRLNIPIPAGQLYEGHSLDSTTDRAGITAYLNSYRQYGILLGQNIFLGDRESESGKAGGLCREGYSITNHGTKSLFTKLEPGFQPKVDIRQFDEFQANLLRNYSFYCKSFCQNKEAIASAPGRMVAVKGSAK